MHGLFSPDSKFMQAMSRIFDLVILNILFLLTCLPVFTIGAASAALYTVCFRIGTEREDGVLRCYFRAFRENFKQGTAIFLLLLLFGLASGVNIRFFSTQEGILHWLSYLSVLLLAIVALIYSYAFPLLSQFNNSIKSTLSNAMLLSVGYLPRSLLMALLNSIPLVLLLFQFYMFLQMGFLWVFLYFSATAYLNALILRKVFAPYLKNEEETQ